VPKKSVFADEIGKCHAETEYEENKFVQPLRDSGCNCNFPVTFAYLTHCWVSCFTTQDSRQEIHKLQSTNCFMFPVFETILTLQNESYKNLNLKAFLKVLENCMFSTPEYHKQTQARL